MKAWLVGGLVLVAVGAGAVVFLPRKAVTPPVEVAAPAPAVARPAVADPAPTPAEPAPLPAVVELVDLAPLLDPPAPAADPVPAPTGVIAVGFDEPADWQTHNWHAYPDTQGRFADPGVEVAPPPREATPSPARTGRPPHYIPPALDPAGYPRRW